MLFDELYIHNPIRRDLFKVFKSNYKGMVTLKGHSTYLRCPHHLERCSINVSIAYIPEEYIIGVSKLARIADYYAQGLITQEDYTYHLGTALDKVLKPKGVLIVINGEHLCMKARGVKTSGSLQTSFVSGDFKQEGTARDEALALLGGVT